MFAIKNSECSQPGQRTGAALIRVEALMRELTEADGGDTILARAIDHHLSAGGGRVRAKIALDVSERLGGPIEDAIAISVACELLHNASLLHDDLMDRDQERRGVETVWSKFGDGAALLAGDLMVSATFAALARIRWTPGLQEVIDRAHRAAASTIKGQSAEAFAGAVYDLERYEKIAAGKSAPLLALPVIAPLLLTKHSRSIGTAEAAADAFGVAYQISDDIADAEEDERTSSKPGALNVVHVFERRDGLSRADAKASAAAHAKRRLRECRGFAAALPFDAGAPIIALGDKLTSTLENLRHAS